MISDVGVVALRGAVDESEDLTVEVEAPDGAVVAGWDELVAVERVEGEAVDWRRVRLKFGIEISKNWFQIKKKVKADVQTRFKPFLAEI